MRSGRWNLDVEEDGHGRPGVLLDEVEPDRGLVGDVLDHPVHAVLHCTATNIPPSNRQKIRRVSEMLDGNPHRTSKKANGGRERLVAEVTAEEAVGGAEGERRRGGGGGCGGAVVHVRARRRATITDSPPPLGERLSDSRPLAEKTTDSWLGKFGFGGLSKSRAFSFRLLCGRRLKNTRRNY